MFYSSPRMTTVGVKGLNVWLCQHLVPVSDTNVSDADDGRHSATGGDDATTTCWSRRVGSSWCRQNIPHQPVCLPRLTTTRRPAHVQVL